MAEHEHDYVTRGEFARHEEMDDRAHGELSVLLGGIKRDSPLMLLLQTMTTDIAALKSESKERKWLQRTIVVIGLGLLANAISTRLAPPAPAPTTSTPSAPSVR